MSTGNSVEIYWLKNTNKIVEILTLYSVEVYCERYGKVRDTVKYEKYGMKRFKSVVFIYTYQST